MFEPMFCGSKKLKLIALGKPQAQERVKVYKVGKFTHGTDPEKSRNEKAYIRALANNEVIATNWEVCHKEMPVGIEIKCYREIPQSTAMWKRYAAKLGLIVPVTKKGDVDNIAKLCLDALTGVVYHDDAQIFDLHITVRYSDTPRTEITVTGYFVNVGEIKDKVKLEQAKEKQK